ncbi:hypothetical protein [Rhodohalobacter sp. 8-1]|uniref:hypothetical protein n=1 Tax=Rhodohalobacter sp. 8-1 TaxID=3131972 RepID=UPI0030EDFA58
MFRKDPIDRRYLDFSPQTHGLTLDMTGVGWVQERRISFKSRPGARQRREVV